MPRTLVFLATLAFSGTLVAWGLALMEQAGPCTVQLGLGGLGLMAAGGLVGVGGLVRFIVRLRGPAPPRSPSGSGA